MTRDEIKAAANSPERIWLEPVDDPYSPDVTRMWCDDDVWGPEEPGVPYIRADLAAQRPASDGWRLVPVAPTDEMIDAVFALGPHIAGSDFSNEEIERKAWAAMLAAAPAPPGATASVPEPGADGEVERLREVAAEAELQITYLHEKFGATGSGAAVLTRLRAALNGAAR